MQLRHCAFVISLSRVIARIDVAAFARVCVIAISSSDIVAIITTTLFYSGPPHRNDGPSGWTFKFSPSWKLTRRKHHRSFHWLICRQFNHVLIEWFVQGPADGII